MKEPVQDLLEPAVILLILAANATVGLWQRGNADAALQALKDCQCPTARVLRRAEGAEASQLVTVPAAELVPGDVVTVRFEGDVWMREKGQGERRGGANGEGRRMRRSVHCTMQCLLVVSAQ